MTLDCVIPTQSSVIQTAMQCWFQVFFQFYHNVCLLLVYRHIYNLAVYVIIILSQIVCSVPVNEF